LKRIFGVLGMGALVLSCVTAQPQRAPVLSVGHYVERRPLPVHPEAEALPESIPKGESVEPLEAASCVDEAGKLQGSGACPARSGLLISEERAFRDALFRIRYKEMRSLYDADRQVWGAQRELYEERVSSLHDALRQAQPTFFEKYALQFGVVGGFLIGAGLTVGLTYALSPTVNPAP
jgi:hypothetical protein